MTEREKALRRLQTLGFALLETVLYLDGHPRNSAALRYYQKIREEYATATRAYEEAYGPVTVMTPGTDGATRDGTWLWSTTPWPWETVEGEVTAPMKRQAGEE